MAVTWSVYFKTTGSVVEWPVPAFNDPSSQKGFMEVTMNSQGDHAACEVQAGAQWEMCPQGCSTSMVVLGGYHLLGS